jgi:hypothetical protein
MFNPEMYMLYVDRSVSKDCFLSLLGNALAQGKARDTIINIAIDYEHEELWGLLASVGNFKKVELVFLVFRGEENGLP